MTTVASWAASAVAVAAPIPDVAPVITTTLPVMSASPGAALLIDRVAATVCWRATARCPCSFDIRPCAYVMWYAMITSM